MAGAKSETRKKTTMVTSPNIAIRCWRNRRQICPAMLSDLLMRSDTVKVVTGETWVAVIVPPVPG